MLETAPQIRARAIPVTSAQDALSYQQGQHTSHLLRDSCSVCMYADSPHRCAKTVRAQLWTQRDSKIPKCAPSWRSCLADFIHVADPKAQLGLDEVKRLASNVKLNQDQVRARALSALLCTEAQTILDQQAILTLRTCCVLPPFAGSNHVQSPSGP